MSNISAYMGLPFIEVNILPTENYRDTHDRAKITETPMIESKFTKTPKIKSKITETPKIKRISGYKN
ncbi:MAG: hypothetical protein ACW7DQ_18780, partial [Paraglaciecola chathamensis]